jgi:hypothetical protein
VVVVVPQGRVELETRLLEIGDRLDAMAVVVVPVTLELVDERFEAAADDAQVAIAPGVTAQVHRGRRVLEHRLRGDGASGYDARKNTGEGEKTNVHDDLSMMMTMSAHRDDASPR